MYVFLSSGVHSERHCAWEGWRVGNGDGNKNAYARGLDIGLGAAYGTAKSGIGIAGVGTFRPDLIMKVG